jgi:outer membrane protein TolC
MRNLIWLSIFLLSAPAFAETLTWEQCVQEALANNPALRASAEKRAAADANVGGARAGFFPQLNGSVNYTKSSKNGGAASPGAAASDSNNSYAATLSLSQNLFSGFQDQAKVAQAKANRASADAALTGAQAKVISDLKVAFSALNYAQAALDLQERIVKRRRENLNLIQLRFKSGRENRGSVLLSQAYAEQAVLDRMTAANAIASARTDLARVLGREPGDFDLKGNVPLSALPAAEPNFRGLASEAPDVRQSLADVGVASAAVTTAKSGFFPTLALNASAGRQDKDWFPEREKWSVGATLTFPLFNGGKDYYGAQSASSSLMAARLTLDNITRDKVTKLREAFNAYAEGIQKVKVDDGFRDAAALRAEIARAKYNNGLMTFEDWDVVENDLIAREKAMLVSRRELVRLEAEWLAVQGKTL